MKDFIILLLYVIGSNVTIKLVGDISLSDIIVVLYFIFYLYQSFFVKFLKSDRDIYIISKLYVTLFFIQLLAELFVGNEYKNILRGLSVTVLSLMKFVFFWFMFLKSKRNIVNVLLCMLIVSLFTTQNVDGVTEDDILEGTSQAAFTYFKFRIAPMIGLGLTVLSLFQRKMLMVYLFIYFGLACIILGARSTGLMISMSGIIGYLFVTRNKLNKKKVWMYSIFSSVVCYILFVVYINAVLTGKIVSGNSAEQIKNLENPYNPISFLLSGRTESPGSIAAIQDSPIIGWGAWAEDPDLKYTRIKLAFQGELISLSDYKRGSSIIPGHSVLLQTGVNNGVLAMFTMAMILFFFIKRGFLSLCKSNKYLFLVIYCIMQLFWNGLFSPLSHFRGLFPLYFAICLYSYKMQVIYSYGKESIGSNSYFRKS